LTKRLPILTELSWRSKVSQLTSTLRFAETFTSMRKSASKSSEHSKSALKSSSHLVLRTFKNVRARASWLIFGARGHLTRIMAPKWWRIGQILTLCRWKNIIKALSTRLSLIMRTCVDMMAIWRCYLQVPRSSRKIETKLLRTSVLDFCFSLRRRDPAVLYPW